jgi:hypothetical protein
MRFLIIEEFFYLHIQTPLRLDRVVLRIIIPIELSLHIPRNMVGAIAQETDLAALVRLSRQNFWDACFLG